MKTHTRIAAGREQSGSVRGFTFVELLMAAVVMGTAVIAASWSMTATARTKAAYDQASSPAALIAKEIYELAGSLPRAPAGLTGATNAGQVQALDALVGASFCPPIRADGSVATGLPGWRQQVGLSVYAMDDLSAATADDPAAGLPPDTSKLYRLHVHVLHDGQPIDSFSWWMTP